MKRLFDKFARKASQAAGSANAFGITVLLIAVWAVFGPITGYSDSWQLVVNTTSTIVTTLVVFLIQHSQDKDTKALHAKLNELIKAIPEADNHFRNLEKLSDEELDKVLDRSEEIGD